MRGDYNEEGKYTVHDTVTCYQVDVNKNMRPSAFMDVCQELAYLAAEKLHFGYDDLQTKSYAWVLSRLYFKFIKTPVWGEDFKVQTWHKGAFGPFYLRDFYMADENGNDLMRGTSSWLVLDVKERRMVRTTEILEMIPEGTVVADHSIEKPADKVMIPKALVLEPVASHVASYADVDLLGHTNNARYMVWAMNCLDYDYVRTHKLDDVCINFNHEVLPGSTVELVRANDGDIWYVEGLIDGKSAFITRLTFE